MLVGSWTVTGMGWSSSATGLPSLFSNLKSWQIVFQWRNLLETRQLLQDQIPSGRANTWCGWAAWGIQKGICFLHWLMEWHCFFSCFCWAFLYDWQFPFLMPQAYKTTKSCLGPHIFNHILCICSFLNGKESLNISLLAPPLVVEVQQNNTVFSAITASLFIYLFCCTSELYFFETQCHGFYHYLSYIGSDFEMYIFTTVKPSAMCGELALLDIMFPYSYLEVCPNSAM